MVWGLGQLIKLIVWRNWLDKKDTFICITGVEGSGKSALSLSLAKYIDKTFEEEMNNRIIFSVEDIPIYDQFFQYRSKRILDGEIVKPEAFIIDEGQNIFFTRTAMEKKQKEMVKKVRTQRYALATVFINLPNLTELDKSIISRLSAVIVCGREEEAYVSLRGLGKFTGSLDYLYDKLMELRKRGITPLMEPNWLSRYIGNNIFDAYGKKRIDRELYEKYFKVKVKRSMELFMEREEEEIKKEDSRRVVKVGYFKTQEYFTQPTPVLYLNCYYSIAALTTMLKVGVHTISRNLSDLPSVRRGRYKYLLAKDVVESEWFRKRFRIEWVNNE